MQSPKFVKTDCCNTHTAQVVKSIENMAQAPIGVQAMGGFPVTQWNNLTRGDCAGSGTVQSDAFTALGEYRNGPYRSLEYTCRCNLVNVALPFCNPYYTLVHGLYVCATGLPKEM